MAMIVNTSWLLEYLEPQVSHQAVLDALPRAGLEIEQLWDLKTALREIHIGFVREKRPLAEGLFALKVAAGEGETVSIVCGDAHPVEVGWGVPVARAGTTLPTGRKPISAGAVHGVQSDGMICLDGELGLIARGSGMQVFHDATALGKPLPDLIGIEEYLVEVNVLANRPDFLGLIGIARDVAAILNVKLKYPARMATTIGTHSDFAVELLEPALCPRYSAQVIHGVRVGPSPQWLKSRLLVLGEKPINNIVDITNYIMFEWGQPLHAFDYRKLKGGRIVVRRMRSDEKMQLLSKATIDGAKQPLVIADAERPIALAGIMGGSETQTDEQTRDILLEAAYFDPVNIRGTVRQIKIGLESGRTESALRYERGTDPNDMLDGAFEAACKLIADIAGGSLAGPRLQQYPSPLPPRQFNLDPQRLSDTLGLDVAPAVSADALRRLGMTVTDDPAAGVFNVSVPTWRADVNDPVVLMEDVARMVGYEKILAAASLTRPTQGMRSARDLARESLASFLVGAGYSECRTPSLQPPTADHLGIKLRNPDSEEMSVLRDDLLWSLLRVAERNLRRGAPAVRLFEIDRVFSMNGPEPASRWRIAGLLGGLRQPMDWRESAARIDFYDLKGVVENLFAFPRLHGAVLEAFDAPQYTPGVAAGIRVNGSIVGHLGEVTAARVDLGKSAIKLFAFECDLDVLVSAMQQIPRAAAIARTPGVWRDLAIVVGKDQVYELLDQAIRQAGGAALESFNLTDQYQGSQVPAGKKSLAFHLEFRDATRTLTAEEVNQTITRIVNTLGERFGAELRA